MRARAVTLAGALVACLVVSTATGAAEMHRSDATPSADDSPVLTLVTDAGRERLGLAGIESAGLHEAELRHFEGPQGRFTGVRLRDFVARHARSGFERLRLIAADGYTVFLTPEDLAERSYLLATRFQGEPVPADRLGPLMLVVPEDEQAVLAGDPSMTQWIWGIVEIHAR